MTNEADEPENRLWEFATLARNQLEEKLLLSWREEEIPASSELDECGTLEGRDLIRIFGGLSFEKIDLKMLLREDILIFASLNAGKYYLASYLLVHVRDDGPLEDGPNMSLMYFLTHKKVIRKLAPLLSRDQISCVIDFLDLASDNLWEFNLEDKPHLVEKALVFWRDQEREK